MILYEQHRKNSSEMSGYSINNILRFVRIERRIYSFRINERTEMHRLKMNHRLIPVQLIQRNLSFEIWSNQYRQN